MSGWLKQAVKSLLTILFTLIVPMSVEAAVLSSINEQTKAKQEAEQVVPIDNVVDSVNDFFDSLAEGVNDLSSKSSPIGSAETLADVKSDGVNVAPSTQKTDEKPTMIKVKRLDQGSAATQAAGEKKQEEPAPYKVYAAPMIMDDDPAPPPQTRVITPEPADNFTGWNQDNAKTVDLGNPPELPDRIQKALGEKGSDKLVPMLEKMQTTAPMAKPTSVPPTSALPKQYFPIIPMGGNARSVPQLLPLASSMDLNEDHSKITRVIFYIHDMTRNAAEGIATLMTLSGSDGEPTLILAPQFSLDVDIMRFAKVLPDAGRQVARWTVEDGWQYGGESVLVKGQRGISSFTAMDLLLMYMTDRTRFPELRNVVMVGHGVGGDFVQRYAAMGRAPALMKKEGLPVHFVVANASTYLYMTNLRPLEKESRFAAPQNAAECPNYNNYPYGLMALASYPKAVGANAIRLDYADKNITYLVGDKIMIDHYLDHSCAANVQGSDRTVRGKNFGRYLDHSFGEAIARRQKVVTIPNAGYDPVALFGSYCGMSALFGDGICQAD